MQHVELMDRQLRQRTAGCAMLVPAPGLRRELERPFVGEIGFDESDAAELAGIDRGADLPDPGHQACAVSHRHGDVVLRLEVGDGEAFFQRAGDRLLGVDMLARLGDLECQRQMLLVGNGENDPLDRGIGQHRGQIGHGGNPQLAREGVALLLRTAIGRHDLERLRLRCRARKHLGPASEPDNPDFGYIHGTCPMVRRSYPIAGADHTIIGRSVNPEAARARHQPQRANSLRPRIRSRRELRPSPLERGLETVRLHAAAEFAADFGLRGIERHE